MIVSAHIGFLDSNYGEAFSPARREQVLIVVCEKQVCSWARVNSDAFV